MRLSLTTLHQGFQSDLIQQVGAHSGKGKQGSPPHPQLLELQNKWFSTNTQLMFASVVLDGVLGHLGLALHTVHFPVVWKQCMRQVKALEGRHVSSKALQGSETRVLPGRTEEKGISLTRGSLLSL